MEGFERKDFSGGAEGPAREDLVDGAGRNAEPTDL